MNISNELSKNKEEFFISVILILIPVIFLTGSSVINSSIILIDTYFLYSLLRNKDFKYLNNKYFYSLIIFWIYLIINLFFSIDAHASLSRSIGFIRFVLFAFAINYFLNHITEDTKKFIFNLWLIIFLFVSIDLIFEFIFGFNMFGFESPFSGRLGGVLGEELKIGHFYFAFILIVTLSSYKLLILKYNKIYLFYFLVFLFLIVSLIIGERANFIKSFLVVSIFLFFLKKENFFKNIAMLIIFLIVLTTLLFKVDRFKHSILEGYLQPLISNPVEYISQTKYGSHYKVALQVFNNNKFFGVGLRNYRQEVKNEKYDRDASIHPHQVHFEILSELGLIGYILFISVFFFILFQSTKLYLKKKDSLMLCGILFIISSLIPLLPSGSFFTTYGAALFWFNFSFILPKNT